MNERHSNNKMTQVIRTKHLILLNLHLWVENSTFAPRLFLYSYFQKCPCAVVVRASAREEFHAVE